MGDLKACIVALVALLKLREGGTSRELGDARAAAQAALDKVAKDVGKVELPKY